VVPLCPLASLAAVTVSLSPAAATSWYLALLQACIQL
jgi:hypothetical protein